jgi:MFS transporter, DHA1 family, multidrug resistance protein
MVVSAVLLSIVVFWFAWTSRPDVCWAAQVCLRLFPAAGIMLNLLSMTSYVVEVYLPDSGSAIAANICDRSAMAAAFPLFTVRMLERLETEWAAGFWRSCAWPWGLCRFLSGGMGRGFARGEG